MPPPHPFARGCSFDGYYVQELQPLGNERIANSVHRSYGIWTKLGLAHKIQESAVERIFDVGTGNVKAEEDRMILFISGALFGMILGLTVSAYAAGIFGTGRPSAVDRYKGRGGGLR